MISRRTLIMLGLWAAAALVTRTGRADTLVCEHLAAPLQSARFDKPLAALDEFVPEEGASKAELEAAIDKIEEKDARNYLFKVEGLTRIYRSIYGKDMKLEKAAIKQAEDLVGWCKDKVDFLEYAKSVHAPKRVLKAMKATRDEAHANLLAYMPKFRGMIEDLKSEISEVDWENQTKDRKHVVRAIADEIHERESLDYDLTDLQNGIHEMRRNLRWILIYIQTLDGMILADKGAGDLHEYSYLESNPIAQSKYAKLDPNPAVKHPVHIPLTYFLALSKLVEELGVIKSTGEHIESIAQGYLDSGLARSRKQAEKKARALIARDPKAVPDITAAATEVRDELARTQLLKRLRKTLEHAIGK